MPIETRSEQFMFRISPRDKKMVLRISKEDKRSVADVIRLLIEREYEARYKATK